MTEQVIDEQPKQEVAVKKPDRIISVDTSDNQLILDTGKFEQAYRAAQLMASSTLVPKHLQGKPSDCFLVINQAMKWACDPFSLAQHTYIVHGKLGYEGKAVASAINTHPALGTRLNYAYAGEGKDREVTVTATLKNEARPREVKIKVKDVKTDNKQWDANPDQMLAYRGAREWARRHMPEAILGIYTDDEILPIISPGVEMPQVEGQVIETKSVIEKFEEIE